MGTFELKVFRHSFENGYFPKGGPDWIQIPRIGTQISVGNTTFRMQPFSAFQILVSGRLPAADRGLRSFHVRVRERGTILLELTTEMVDDSNQVKNLVIRVEDARILNDMNVVLAMALSTLGV
jgi:hypothetical protein